MNDKSKDKNKTAASDKPKREPRTSEQKAAKFKELATKRTSRAINAIRGIGNLASGNYQSTPDQRGKVLAALKGAVQDVENRFTSPATVDAPSFSLD